MNMKKTTASIIITAMVVMTVFTGAAAAKSLYVIADINTNPNPTPIMAYDIQGNTLVPQATYYVPYHGIGAVGLTIDTDSETLFVTYESSNTIEKIDAKIMQSVGNTTVTGALNLAGIVVDQDKGLVYAVDRTTHNLYIYNLNFVYQSTIALPTGSGSYGIALDEINDLLYVADRSTTVRYYDTTNWLEQGNFAVSHDAVGIAVDTPRQMVYTVAGFAASNLLSKYDLGSVTESTVDMGYGGMGAAVDRSTGLIYISGGYSRDDVSVWNPSTMCRTNSTGYIGNPTGLCVPGKDGVGYNPLNITETNDVADSVDVGDTITYTIRYDSQQINYDVHNVTIVDTLPANVSFVSVTGGGTYIPAMHTVTWDIGTVIAGSSGACVTLTVSVNAGAENTILTNCAVIDGDEIGPTQLCVDTDVIPPEPVPALTLLGMIPMIGLLLVLGFVTLRREG